MQTSDERDPVQNKRSNTQGGRKIKKKKNLSAFDEYEQRGGVLEGYEDLNSESDDNDRVLSQMVEEQSDSRS